MSDGVIRAAVKNEGPAQVMIKPGSWMANIEFVRQLILLNNINIKKHQMLQWKLLLVACLCHK